jgi:hypothetical protein
VPAVDKRNITRPAARLKQDPHTFSRARWNAWLYKGGEIDPQAIVRGIDEEVERIWNGHATPHERPHSLARHAAKKLCATRRRYHGSSAVRKSHGLQINQLELPSRIALGAHRQQWRCRSYRDGSSSGLSLRRRATRRRPGHEKLATACTETGPRRTSSPPLTGRVRPGEKSASHRSAKDSPQGLTVSL